MSRTVVLRLPMTPLMSLPDALPITLALAVLVGVFVSLQRHTPSGRVRLWTCAWALAFLHFFARAVEIHTGAFEHLLQAIDFGALELSSVVFLCSMVFGANEQKKRIALALLLGLPLVSHSFAIQLGWGTPGTAIGLLAMLFLGSGTLSVLMLPKRADLRLFTFLAFTAGGIWAIREQVAGNPYLPLTVILAGVYILCSAFFWRLYRRRSLGVIAVAAGFVAWGAIYPLGLVFYSLAPNKPVHLDFWNLPRFLVALGMVLTLLEDKSVAIEEARARAEAESLFLQRLSQITSRLLAGNDPAALCGEAAAAITEASSYRRAALFRLGEDRRFYLAGSSGFTKPEAETLQTHSGSYAVESLKQRRALGAQPNRKSFRMSEESGLMLIPLVSWRGSHVGCLYVSDPKESSEPDASEMVRLEVFASDLAVTFENVKLHQELVRSEKLAGLGQLVAGVAHELNNPLTGVIGYTDLLSEEVREAGPKKRIEKLGHEARRMKRIVDGLLRFGRQTNSASRSTSFAAVVPDVIQLRDYHLRARGVRLDLNIEPLLPPVGIAEDELKQLLLNILNNAVDAIEDSVQREIQIRASHRFGRIVIEFEDSGPGFADPSRAFDPFYTTKAVGKGTGLGLSICYGIVQECGGEISVVNKDLFGARVTIDLPVAVAQPVLVPPALITRS
jgi:two-component system, NtrC family, sensor kinase